MTAAITSGWQTPSYCSDCYANHPGSCNCDCHRTSGAARPRTARNWRDSAACRAIGDADLFFPAAPPNTEAGDRQVARALAVCRSCLVRTECREFAETHAEREGIWGGTTPDERNAAARHLMRGAA